MTRKVAHDKPYSWATKAGGLTDLGRGIAYGLYLGGVPIPRLVERFASSNSSMRKAIRETEIQLGVAARPPADPEDEPPTSKKRVELLELTPRQKAIAERRKEVDGIMKHKEDGHYTAYCSRDVRRE
eukprot:CAMPEP_0176432468 /NCGR_PEP_ID=MMETSP0127-20121128/15412_1 /TAXON_ID=938130 /ORGANISM="Platyophrya macrostoma, Strain WH" /LENGTH=126 /DNA_ID=CAMNT_0017814645 /DNA_START=71 /DNA_END=448 /DNA_ORIENTATION=+